MPRTLSSLPYALLIPALARETKPFKPSWLRINTDLLRLKNNILPNHSVKLNITPRIISQRARNLVPPPTHALPRVATVVIAVRPRAILRRLPEFEQVFQCGHRHDHDRHAHLGHRPYVDTVPVGAGLDRDEAREVDGDGQEAEGEGEDEAVFLAAAEGENAD